MSLRVSVCLQPHRGVMQGTNRRAFLVGESLRNVWAECSRHNRDEALPADVDLIVQTGFAPTVALTDAISRRIPYILAECPVFRHDPEINYNNWVSWGYNGLCGTAFHPPAPSEELWKPELLPAKTEGPTIIFAQKPNDRSLRGHDHSAWIVDKLEEYPDAEFRPHPLMTTAQQEPIVDALDRCHRAITYSSTAGAEALLRGCISLPEHPGSWGYNVYDREEWLHERSWHGFPDQQFLGDERIGKYILSGYNNARERAKAGLVEMPRPKIVTNMHRYITDDPRVTETMK